MSEQDPIDFLAKKYPSVFKNMDNTSYYTIPAGWIPLVEKLCKELSPILDEERKRAPEAQDNPLFVLLQVKEKFGGLRFYYAMNTENNDIVRTVQRMVDSAEDTSYTVCEVTGKKGDLCRSGNHFKTLCEELRISNGFTIVGNP